METKDIDFAAIPQKAINVVTRPAEFFQAMPKTGGFMEPLVFAAIMGLVAGVIQAVLSVIGLGHGGAYGAGVKSGLAMIIFMPIFAAIGSFIGAAILFVIWKLMGSQEEYETAYRCGAYLMVLTPITSIINVVPYAGVIISLAICTFYIVTASVHAHNIPSQKAWLVFGIIGIIFALGSVSAQQRARNMTPEWEKLRQASEEYRKSARDMEKSTEALRKQNEEMIKQAREQMEEAKRQAEQNQ